MKTDINYKKISNNAKVIKLLKERERLEDEILKIDKMALVNYELEKLSTRKP